MYYKMSSTTQYSNKCLYCNFISNEISDCTCFETNDGLDFRLSMDCQMSEPNMKELQIFESAPKQINIIGERNVLLDLEELLVKMNISNIKNCHIKKFNKIKSLNEKLNDIYNSSDTSEEKLQLYLKYYSTEFIAWEIFYDMNIFEVIEKDMLLIIELLEKKSMEFYKRSTQFNESVIDFNMYCINKFIDAFIPIAKMLDIEPKPQIAENSFKKYDIKSKKQEIIEHILYYKRAYERNKCSILK